MLSVYGYIIITECWEPSILWYHRDRFRTCPANYGSIQTTPWLGEVCTLLQCIIKCRKRSVNELNKDKMCSGSETQKIPRLNKW